jgi:dienelactone hydrolase
MISVNCPACGKCYQVKPELGGKRFRCKACEEPVSVPKTTVPKAGGESAVLARPKSKPAARNAPGEDDEFAALLSESAAAEQEFDAASPEAIPRRPRGRSRGRTTGRSSRGGDSVAIQMLQTLNSVWTEFTFRKFCQVVAYVWLFAGAAVMISRQLQGRPASPLGESVEKLHAAAHGATAPAGAMPMPAASVAAAQPRAPYDLSQFPIPKFPDLGEPLPGPANVRRYLILLSSVPGQEADKNTNPGQTMALSAMLPPGDHPAASLGCVLVPPAGAMELIGHQHESVSYFDEYLPYLAAGYVVVHYETDGGLLRPQQEPSPDELGLAYRVFSKSAAGLVNGRNAIEFILQKLPMVDPQRIAAAGHSSAGANVLLLAAHEPRLSAVIAYGARAQVRPEILQLVSDPQYSHNFPGAVDFLYQSSVSSHLSRIGCPVFLFHAQDDPVVPASESLWMSDRLKERGAPVQLELVPTGGHSDGMFQSGIPKAVQWLQTLWR